jgi:heme/copper-type cytochrome/quinol oxidase subunit 2
MLRAVKHLAQIANTSLDQFPPYPHMVRLLWEGVFLFLVLLIIALLVYITVVLAYVVLREKFKTGELEKYRVVVSQCSALSTSTGLYMG